MRSGGLVGTGANSLSYSILCLVSISFALLRSTFLLLGSKGHRGDLLNSVGVVGQGSLGLGQGLSKQLRSDLRVLRSLLVDVVLSIKVLLSVLMLQENLV